MGAALNPDQLRMFMTPREIVDEYRPNDYRAYDRWPDERAMWGEKTADALRPGSDVDAHFVNPANGRKLEWGVMRSGDDPSLVDSVRKSGVKRPVEVFHVSEGHPDWHSPQGGYLSDGTHRVAAQMLVDPDRLIPVSHSELPLESGESNNPNNLDLDDPSYDAKMDRWDAKQEGWTRRPGRFGAS